MRRSSAISALMMVIAVMTDSEATRAWGASANGDDDRFQTYPVEVNIGKRGYLVPRNYVVNIRFNRKTNKDTRAMLRALWPGLEPLTPENAHLWERRMPERQIAIHIVDYGTDGYQQLKNALRVRAVDPEPKPARFDLTKYSRTLDTGAIIQMFVSEDSSSLTPHGTPVVFRCDEPPTTAKKSFDVEVLCKVDYQLDDGAWLYYTFFIRNLIHWREIDQSIRMLIGSWRK